jgi:hypothetical protein
MTDNTSLTTAKLLLTGAYTLAEAEAIAARLDADSGAPHPPVAPAAPVAPGAPAVPPPAFVEAMEAGRPIAQYTVEQLRALKAADFARMDPTQWAEVQKVLKQMGPGGRR